MVFHDPVPMEVRICYRIGGLTAGDDKSLLKHAISAYQIVDEDWANVSKINRYKTDLLKEYSVVSPSPKIDCKIITTPARKSRLLRPEKNAQDYLDANKP